jgi:hypothetical protein
LNNGGNSLVCDFNSDSQCNGADIDMLQANIVTGPVNPAIFDLTGDGQVTIADRNEWLILAGATNLASGNAYLSGDANLDGSVDVSDFNVWNSNKFSATSAWTSGDFNADGSVDVSDFNVWNSNKFQSADSARSSAVPTLQPATAFASELGSDLDKDSDREQDNANLLDIVFGDWS